MQKKHKKRILFLTQVLPYPLDAGPKIRAYYVLRYLSQYFKITLISFTRKTDKSEYVDHLSKYCEKVITVKMKRSRFKDFIALIKSFLFNKPFLILRDTSGNFAGVVNDVMAGTYPSFEYIHADQLWMAQYAINAGKMAMRISDAPKLVLDQHNAVFLIPKRMSAKTNNFLIRLLLQAESKRLFRFEKETCLLFNHVVWVTKDDFNALYMNNHAHDLAYKNTIIPICINPDAVQHKVHPAQQKKNILFVGGMHWPPNTEGILWFTNKVFPIIQETIHDVTLYAIGKSPPASLNNTENIVVPGFVEDLTDFWDKSRVFIVPIFSGGGMRVKILDAWTHGLPIVSTSIGAEGIDTIHGENILIADTPAEFAQQIIRLLSNDELADSLSKNGLEWVRTHYNWSRIYPLWDQVYNIRKTDSINE